VDALGRPVTGRLAIGDGTAVLEMASAAGLELVPEGERDVLGSDTRGVGRMIRAALDAGIGRLLLGIGGSATNDGGAGMLAELGVRFLDRTGRVIGTTPRELTALASVDASGLDPRLEGLTIDVACDGVGGGWLLGMNEPSCVRHGVGRSQLTARRRDRDSGTTRRTKNLTADAIVKQRRPERVCRFGK